ncbi:GNAT family N-acetyltransferase [Clostridium sp.]|uniref:GNAT family N-acetyltransferase n=1 Tax=Clostridium sp. TaxID=1506 RepID=UPI003216E524
MFNIEIISGSKGLLEHVGPLWEKLNHHHKGNSINFKEKYEKFSFKERRNGFLAYKNDNININLVRDKDKNIYVGYCVSTVNSGSVGEISSLYIEPEYRKYGIGDELIKRAIKWLDDNEASKKIIGVAAGNEDVLKFYERHGFRSRTIILEQC